MLTIIIPEWEDYNDETMEFTKHKAQKLVLEHSLVSISKWESTWRKPFLGNDDKTVPETLDYIRCMTLTQNVNPWVYTRITNDLLDKIQVYINTEQTATTFNDKQKRGSKKIMTSEVIYFMIASHGLSMECQKWHLSRLMTLIRIAAIKNNPNKTKTNRRDIIENNQRLNKERREKYNSKG